MNHFTRLIELTTADEEYVVALATTLAPCVIRPRVETSLTMEEKHTYRLMRDLFAHKTAIFSELKRMSTIGHSISTTSAKETPRPRAISTDESNRRMYQEERQRALLEKAGGSRSRATSPAPSPRGSGGSHRRDRSVGRFPVQTSPTERQDRARMSMGPILGVKRSSLEVPGESGTPTSATHPSTDSSTNGSESTTDSPSSTRSRSETLRSTESLDKRNSLGRNPARMSLGRRIPVNPTPLATDAAEEHVRGVTLEDKPMDD